MNLYRRSIFEATLVVVLATLISVAAAQGLRRKPHQLRATSLAEVTTDSHGVISAHLIPITILDDGSFHDASIYKNSPEPMVLDPGVVYEVQKTGETVGYLTVGKATKEKDNWTALGKWQPASPPSKATTTATPTPTNPAEERPVLHRAGARTAAPSPTVTPTPTASPGATTPPTPEDNSASDRPVLHRPSSEASPTPSTSPVATAPTPTPQPEADTEPVDPDRPTLRRRTPHSSAEMPQTTPSPATRSGKPATAAATVPGLRTSPGTQSLVAVSDEQSTDSRSFQFVWKPGEEAAIDAKLRRLALAQLAGPVSESSLRNVVIRSFDLDLSNDAVMVISAEVPPVAAPPAGKSAKSAAAMNSATLGATRYITLIARVDFENNPQKLAFSVTDSSRLDVAPRLELIDAVDVDGDGFGELVFRQYSFDEKSFVIYSIGRSTVTKLFEGASQPIK